ncbi:MAG: FtsH protease activity modulator HflK [Clostridia bacterium]|nr:FtsH protease activity modulator HflK [Clostridia bacterium]
MKSPKFITAAVMVIIIGIWLFSGIYTLRSGEEAVILRFGKHTGTVSKAGLNWRVPFPVDEVIKVNVSEVKRIEFGFETIREGNSAQNANYKEVPGKSQMLTGDENMVNVETAIQYKVTNTEDFLFNVDDQTGTLRIAAESAIRRAIASHTLDEVLTDNKFGIQQEIKDDLQQICDSYKIGIGIIAVQLQDVNPPAEVDAAFKDVANAREDKNSLINEAESYKNEVIPKARGSAAEMVNKAIAYKERRIAEAKGDVANFIQILEKYQLGKDVTRTRMYLETLEEILPGVEKYILDEKGNTLKFLPLDGSALNKDDKR